MMERVLGNMLCDLDYKVKGQIMCYLVNVSPPKRERNGSVVECLTRDRGAAGSSLTGVTVSCP